MKILVLGGGLMGPAAAYNAMLDPDVTQVTIADISLASYLIFSEQARIPLTPYVHLKRWLNQLDDFYWWTETRLELIQILNY